MKCADLRGEEGRDGSASKSLALTIVKNPYLNYKKHLRLFASLKVFRPSYSASDI